MADSANPRYGTLNWDMLKSWFAVAPEDDGQFWAVNLMKYRPLADYSDGRETTLTGEQADDEYAPIEILEDLGAVVAFGARVTSQHAGDPQWDRVAIVRYPSRAEFFDMQRRPDFIERHAHKDAGMEFTIVMSSDPDPLPAEPAPEDAGALVMTVRNLQDPTAPSATVDGVAPVARFEVEGAIVGDERVWHEIRIDRIAEESLEAHVAAGGSSEQVVVVLDTPMFDVLTDSIATRSA
jgi:hypothetical protein